LGWPILAALSGSRAFAAEISDGVESGAQLSLCSRFRLLRLSFLFLLLGMSVCLFASAGTPYRMVHMYPEAPTRWGAFEFAPMLWTISKESDLYFLLGVPVSLQAYSCAALFSQVILRPGLAAGAGWACGMALSAGIVQQWLGREWLSPDCCYKNLLELHWISGILFAASLLTWIGLLAIPARRKGSGATQTLDSGWDILGWIDDQERLVGKSHGPHSSLSQIAAYHTGTRTYQPVYPLIMRQDDLPQTLASRMK
jgi:hypothetical protein